MVNDFIKINYKSRTYSIYKYDSLKTLLSNAELLELPISVWETIFKEKDGMCYYDLLYKVLEAKIKYYDKSSNVNSFYFLEKSYWYDKNTRMGLLNLVNSSKEDITLVLKDNLILLGTDKAKLFLEQLEVYAGKCYVNTAKHLQAIKSLKTIEDLVKYDYTLGYPSKITLKIE